MKHKKVFQFHSIRHRIMLIFVGLMAAMLFAIWGVNSWWLERYYVDQKLKVMEEAYTDIDTVIQEKVGENENIGDVLKSELEQEWEIWKQTAKGEEDSDNADASGEASGADTPKESPKQDDEVPAEDLPAGLPQEQGTLLGTIRSYSEQNNIAMTLIDSDTGKALITSGRDSDFLTQKLQRYVLGKGQKHMQVLKQHDNYVVEKNMDFRSSGTYMESWGYFSDNRTMFIMSMPLASIRESVELSNRFTTWVGLIALVFGSALMCFVTNRITKPILKLSSLSEEMSKLNFDVAYEDDAEDEVGILGRSMNSLSHSLKDAIGALQAANKQLQHDIDEKIQIDEMRKEFIANVSHELKTPIALIQGYAEGLCDGMCEDVESRNYYCEVIMDEANKMNKMVRQLLTLTALEFGNDTPSIEAFDVSELVHDLINSSSILIQQNEAKVTVDMPEILMVMGDEFKIEEVVTNYLTNAMNHLGGEHQIRIWSDVTDKVAKIHVYNNGNPIPEEDLPNLWTKFYKVDKARTRAYGGSGIGLSIVKAIMEAHHQQYGVANREDGVEFWFTLALAPEIPEDQEPAENP